MSCSVRITGALLFLACSASTAAQAASPHPCATLQDDAERLACYDRTFGTPAEPKLIPEPAPPQAATPVPEKFSAVVSKVEWRNGLFVATLDNGQVWSQTELDSRADVRVGDTVNVRRGALGSYLLSTSAGIPARVKRVR